MIQTRRIAFTSATLIALSMLLYVLTPALDLGFVSDDFVHLSADRAKPWFASSDPLHRPLRNGMFKLMAGQFALSPRPYRIFADLTYLACAALFFFFLRKLGLPAFASLAAALLAFFTPRNHALLFWTAAEQDVIYAICVLGMLLCWIQFRQQGQAAGWLAAIVLYAVALGFKETAIVAPALVALTDWFIEWKPGQRKGDIRNWLSYWGFVLPVIGFGWFVLRYPVGISQSAAASLSHSTYGKAGVVRAVLAELRSVLNLINPFEPSFSLRDIGAAQLVALTIVAAMIAGLIAFLPSSRKIWLYAAVWMCIALLPTSIFASTINADYYLFVAGFGVAAAIGFSMNAIAERSRPFIGLLLRLALLLYCLWGTRLLDRRRTEWFAAAAAVQRIVHATELVLPKNGSASVEFINIPHSLDGIPVLANGLAGALLARGYRPGLLLWVNHNDSPPESQEEQLIVAVRACPMTAAEPSNDRRILVTVADAMEDHTSACAEDAVNRDIRFRPWAWIADSSEKLPERGLPEPKAASNTPSNLAGAKHKERSRPANRNAM